MLFWTLDNQGRRCNNTVNRILSEQKKLQIPQVDDLLKNTNRELQGFVVKYKNLEIAELEEKPNFLQRLFNKSKKYATRILLWLKNSGAKARWYGCCSGQARRCASSKYRLCWRCWLKTILNPLKI